MDTSSNEVWKQRQNYKSFELRAHRFRQEMLPVFCQHLGIKPDSHVLDGGCGTGVFTRYLAGGLTEGRVTGFDINEGFVEYGRQKIRELSLIDKVTLEVEDGFGLRYADGTFDAVTNYTYIGVLSAPAAGLKELIRVCRAGGTVSCVIATNQIPQVIWQGDYPFDGAAELQRLAVLENRIFTFFAGSAAELKQNMQWHSFRYPKLFDACGLKDIHVYPLAHLLCYSDTQYPLKYRRELIHEEINDEIEWLTSRYNGKKDIYQEHGFGEREFETLLLLLQKKAEYLAENLESDRSFEWRGGFNFIVTGIKPHGWLP